MRCRTFDEFADAELLKFEKELLGFYITSHPLTEHRRHCEHYSTASTTRSDAMPEGHGSDDRRHDQPREKDASPRTAAPPASRWRSSRWKISKARSTPRFSPRPWQKINKRSPGIVAAEQIVFVKGKVDQRRETPGIIVNELIPISQAMARFTRGVKVEIDRIDGAIETLRELKGILSKHQGNCQTYLSVPATGEKRALIALDKQWWIRATPALKEELEFALNGHGRIELAGDGTRRSKAQQQPLFPGSEVAEIPDETPAMSLPVEEMEY